MEANASAKKELLQLIDEGGQLMKILASIYDKTKKILDNV